MKKMKLKDYLEIAIALVLITLGILVGRGDIII